MSRSLAPHRSDRFAPALLLTLCVVPVLAGSARLAWLATGDLRPDSARFAADPAPLAAHILSACAFCVVGAFQFAPAVRRRWPRWHRAAGRILVATGLLAATSGLWMTIFYAPGANDGAWLYALRLVFGSAMAASLLIGLDALRRRDFASHSAWMMRGYAIGTGAGSQAVIFLPWVLLMGPAGEHARAILMGAGWVVNLAIAEGLIRRRPAGLPVQIETSSGPALILIAGPRPAT